MRPMYPQFATLWLSLTQTAVSSNLLSKFRSLLEIPAKWPFTSVGTIPVTRTHNLLKLPSFLSIISVMVVKVVSFVVEDINNNDSWTLTVYYSDQQEPHRPLCFVIVTWESVTVEGSNSLLHGCCNQLLNYKSVLIFDCIIPSLVVLFMLFRLILKRSIFH